MARTHMAVQPRQLKEAMLNGYRPENFRGNVWLLTDYDEGTLITGSKVVRKDRANRTRRPYYRHDEAAGDKTWCRGEAYAQGIRSARRPGPRCRAPSNPPA